MEEKDPKVIGRLLLTCWEDNVVEVAYDASMDLNLRITALQCALEQELELRDFMLQQDSNRHYTS